MGQATAGRIGSVVALVLVVAGCAASGTAAPSGQASPGPSGTSPGASPAASTPASAAPSTGGDGSIGENAAKVTDPCTLMPTDLVATLVPNAPAPVAGPEPNLCTATNGTQALQITLSTGIVNTDAVPGAEEVSGVAVAAYLERPQTDEAYLTVILSKDPAAVVYVDYAGYDGKDHKDDAVAVAKAIVATLQ